MKYNKKYNLLLTMLIIMINTFGIYAQTPSANMIKYWYYRDRLQYFVVQGLNIGESQIACVRNKILYEAIGIRLYLLLPF